MMGVSQLSLLVLVCLLLALIVQGAPRHSTANKQKDNKSRDREKAKAVRLNVDLLPPLQDELERLGLSPFLKDFVRMGVTETRLLLKLSAMDFQIMAMDWDWRLVDTSGTGTESQTQTEAESVKGTRGDKERDKDLSKDKISKLKQRIQELYLMAVVPEVEVRPELEQRKKLTYGRVYLPNGVQSFEYSLASFGGPLPLGPLTLTLSKSLLECNSSGTADYQGHVVLVKRGNCTFLHKALNLKANNASGMIVVSTEDRLENPSSGYGVDKNITEEVISSLGSFFAVQSANSTWGSLLNTIRFHELENKLPTVHLVPLQCHTGGHCNPLTKEEQALRGEVTWGRLRVRRGASKSQSKSFEFLTSNFGSHLPVGVELPIVKASNKFACGPMENISSTLLSEHANSGVAMFAYRGECRFDVKALNAQNAGARILILTDAEDKALQRLGGMLPDIPFVGIPAVLSTVELGLFLQDGDFLEVFPASDDIGLDNWLQIAYTEWNEDDKERLMQLQGLISKFQETENHDIVSWLQRRIYEIEFGNRKSIDTDESCSA